MGSSGAFLARAFLRVASFEMIILPAISSWSESFDSSMVVWTVLMADDQILGQRVRAVW